MGPGGPHGLQLRWRASFGVRGGFDSLALPPVTCAANPQAAWKSTFFLVPIIGQDFWRGRAPARDFRGFADLLPRTFPRVSSQTGVYDGPGLCIVRVHPPVVHHKFECGELPVMSRRHFRGDRVVTSQITKTPFRSGWFAPIEACTIRYEHRHAAKWAQWNGLMGLVAILNFGYYRLRRIKIRCLNWP